MCGGCVARFRLEQAHADQLPAIMDTLDRVFVQLELARDGGREVNPSGTQLGKSGRLIAGLAQSLEHSLLLGVSERHRLDCRPSAGRRAAAPPPPLVVVAADRALTQAFG